MAKPLTELSDLELANVRTAWMKKCHDQPLETDEELAIVESYRFDDIVREWGKRFGKQRQPSQSRRSF